MRNIFPIKPKHEGRPISGRWVDPEIENQVSFEQALLLMQETFPELDSLYAARLLTQAFDQTTLSYLHIATTLNDVAADFRELMWDWGRGSDRRIYGVLVSYSKDDAPLMMRWRKTGGIREVKRAIFIPLNHKQIFEGADNG